MEEVKVVEVEEDMHQVEVEEVEQMQEQEEVFLAMQL